MTETQSELTNEGLRPNPALYRARLSGLTARCAGVEFDLRPIPQRVARHIDALSTIESGQTDMSLVGQYLVAYGVMGVRGLTDEDGQPIEARRECVNVLGVDLTPLTIEFVECLDIRIVAVLAEKMMELSGLNADERLRLDFTTPSTQRA